MNPSSIEARELLIEHEEVRSILDLGSGDGAHAAAFMDAGKRVTTVDHVQYPSVMQEHYNMDVNKFMSQSIVEGRKWGAVWISHVLEHMPDPHQFLTNIFELIDDDGYLAVTVPPLKHNIVGGHVNLFNEGMLLYRLILAGFDCRDARVGVYGYNISVIVKKKKAELPDDLHMDRGDIEKLAEFFPFDAKQNFNGQTGPINWR